VRGLAGDRADIETVLQCALIIGRRSESTDRKTSLNEALRVFGVQA